MHVGACEGVFVMISWESVGMHKGFDMQQWHTLVMCTPICMRYASACVAVAPLTVTQTCASAWGPGCWKIGLTSVRM